jgi:hypothetical protein
MDGMVRPARHITDARHFLDEKGAIAPRRGPAKVVADFHAGWIAYGTDFDDTRVPAPTCSKCKKTVFQFMMAQDDANLWSCPHCSAEGRVSSWRGTLRDLSDRPDRAC